MKEIYYDDIITASGYTGDIMISALQKFIRRGMEEEAAQAAYELFLCGEELADYVWKRLMVISTEDIGLGDVNAPVVVQSLYSSSEKLGYGSTDYPLFLVHAVRYLCTCKKDRDSANLTSLTKRQIAKGKTLECPDYVFDMHTKQGQEKNRGYSHFFDEAAKVWPKAELLKTGWEEELRSMIEEEKKADEA